MQILGIDIGGTKCAVISAKVEGSNISIVDKKKIQTRFDCSPEAMIDELLTLADSLQKEEPFSSVGISCGGPLDSERGIILGPPNLPGWNNVNIVNKVKQHYGVSVFLQNDANACAVAEWKFGAGKGCNNMVFLTFGTGLGAGLILDGRLYTGTNDNAGECGHIRLNDFGPVGYYKSGSFEGFCSGGGIAQLGYFKALEKVQQGNYPLYFEAGMSADDISAKSIADAADNGDETALEVYRICGEYLGKGLSILIDILNPQKIVIGSVFARSQHLLWEHAKNVIATEALPAAANVCEIVSAELGEKIGDYAAVATALLKGE